MTGSTRFAALSVELTDDLCTDLAATSGRFATVIAPFTGDALHELPLSSIEDVADAAAAARAAQRAWFDSGHAHRRAVLLKGHDLMLSRKDALLDILQTETGKTRGQAFEEVFQGASVARYCALKTRGIVSGHRRRAAIPLVMQTRVQYSPKGLVGVITPWNYPIALSLMDVLPALAAGNGVVQKADNQGVLSILASRRAFIDAGVPAALWAVVAGPG
ncbi:MAG: aldehyde dehydrogenase family protein, partial [Rhodoglobus sp.]